MYEELGKVQLELEKIQGSIAFLQDQAKPLMQKKAELLQKLIDEEEKSKEKAIEKISQKETTKENGKK